MKTTVNKKLTVGLLALVWALVGCQSEVDKCVNAFVKEYGKTEEATARIVCLKAQSGK